MEKYAEILNLKKPIRYSEISDEILDFFQKKTNLAIECEETRDELIKFLSKLSKINSREYILIAKQLEIFSNLVNYESLKRKKILAFSYDPYLKDFVDLNLFEQQVHCEILERQD